MVLIGLFFAIPFGCSDYKDKSFPSWRLSRADNFSFYPIVWNSKVILAAHCQKTDCIKCINLKSGKAEWAVSDPSFRNIYYNLVPYIKDKFLYMPVKSQLLCIDMNNGRIVWKVEKKAAGDNRVFGKGEKLYRTYNFVNERRVKIFEFDYARGSHKIIYEQEYEQGTNIIMRSPIPYSKYNLLFGCAAHHPEKILASDLMILSGDEEVFSYQIYPPNKDGKGATRIPIVDNGFSYWVAGSTVICFDLHSKKECWRNVLPRGLLTSRMIKVGDLLFIAAENEYLYAVNALSGQIKWKAKISGTPSRIHPVEDKIYLIGGADRALYEIIQQSGEILGRFELKGTTYHLDRTSFISDKLYIISDANYWYTFEPEDRGSILQRLN